MAKKLSESLSNVLTYLQTNDNGDGVSIDEIAAALGKTKKQILPVVTVHLGPKAPAAKKGERGALVEYSKRPATIDGEAKEVGYATLTAEGRAYTQDAE